MAELANQFGARLKHLRTEARRAAGQQVITQVELAKSAKISLATLRDVEQGRYLPNWAIVIDLAAALGVDCTAFQIAPAPVESTCRGRPAKGKVAKRTK